jgi:hypothetical protein
MAKEKESLNLNQGEQPKMERFTFLCTHHFSFFNVYTPVHNDSRFHIDRPSKEKHTHRRNPKFNVRVIAVMRHISRACKVVQTRPHVSVAEKMTHRTIWKFSDEERSHHSHNFVGFRVQVIAASLGNTLTFRIVILLLSQSQLFSNINHHYYVHAQTQIRVSGCSP